MSRQPSAVRMALFSQKNRTSLQQVVVQEFEGNGSRLNARQLDRLERTLDHYVEAVYEAQGDQQLPLLNREIVKVTSQDFNKYLQRQNIIQQAPQTPTRTIVTQSNPLAVSVPQYAITQGQQGQQSQQQPQLYLETGQRSWAHKTHQCRRFLPPRSGQPEQIHRHCLVRTPEHCSSP